MKNTYLSGVLGLVLLASPLLASAQSYNYLYPNYSQYQNTGTYTGASGCIALTHYLLFGSSDVYTGGQVTMLQQFLNNTGYLRGVSGYFDQGTLGAVVNYQRDHGIPQTGTVGPLTRATINQQSCNGSYPAPNYPGYPVPNNGISISSLSASSGNAGMVVTIYGTNLAGYNTAVHFGNTIVPTTYASNSTVSFTVPSYSSGTYQVYVTNNYGTSNSISFTVNSSSSNNCYWNNGMYQCGCYNYNNSSYYNNGCNNNYPGTWFGSDGQPRVSSISGPGTASTGSSNTWSAQAYTVNGLPYTVRVDWGDGTSQQSSQSYGSGQQNYPFTHTYLSPGSYTIRFTATDTNGAFAYATLPVSVYGSYIGGNNGNYYGAPNISYVSATTAQRGSTITINGSNFTANNTVYLNGNSYGVSSYNNGTAINFTIPYGINPGSYGISVMNANGQMSNTVNFQIQW